MVHEWVSAYWLAPLAAYVLAQLAKMVIDFTKSNSLGPRPTLFSSGSMPSSHSAVVIALVVAVGLGEGLGSAIFGVTTVFAAIVVYDALNVRRAVGDQGAILKRLTKGERFYTANGHKPLEVLVGSILGAVVAVLMLQIL